MEKPIIAIHQREGSFSDKWIEYCHTHDINYKFVNAFSPTIIDDLKDVDAFMSHWHHKDYVSSIMAKQLVSSLTYFGITIFPNYDTFWHFDDKIAQYYLLQTINAPIPKTWTFYDIRSAKDWLYKNEDFPLVFKLRRGSGSSNVKLIENRRIALNLIRRAFNKGFSPIPTYTNDIKSKVNRINSLEGLFNKVKRMPKSFLNARIDRKNFMNERHYCFFQEFLHENKFDTRVTIIGNRAFAFRRFNRSGDFRASGSGRINYDTSKIDQACIKIAFNISKLCNFQSMAYDFLYKDNKPLINEISYVYDAKAIYDCPGYWDINLDWQKGNFWPQTCIIEDVINNLKS